MSTSLTTVLLGTSPGGLDSDGRLLFVDDRLVAVISKLSSDHEQLAGRWFIEATFGGGRCDDTFTTLDEAASWVVRGYRS